METTNLMNKGWINPISTTVFLILLVISIALYSLNIFGGLILFLCILASALLASSIHIADQ